MFQFAAFHKKALNGTKRLRIRLHKIDVRVYDGTIYLVLFINPKYGFTYMV